MPIRNVVTRGFSNGTFSPGVNKLPTRGYSIGDEVEAIRGGKFVAGQVHHFGFQQAELHRPGVHAGEVHHPGFQSGQVN